MSSFGFREPWEYWDDRCEEEEEWEKLCPVCDKCGRPITDDTYYDVDGRLLHEDCMREEFRRFTDEYVERSR